MVATCREISKINEQCVRGTIAELIDYYSQTEPKGEFVIVVAGKEEQTGGKQPNQSKNKYKNNDKEDDA